TGSRQGGLALVRVAAQREVPIPVYAEMSSINPMFLLADAMEQRAREIGTAFVDSLTLGAGQFCTNPGLIVALQGDALNNVCDAAVSALQAKPASTMLTPGIQAAFNQGVQRFAATPG